MIDQQLRIPGAAGPWCDGCALREPCGAAELVEACRVGWGEPNYGGVNVLHPRNPETWEYLEEVGGVSFDDVVARRQPPITLSGFAHRIRPRRALRGQVHDPVYVIGPDAVRKRGVSPCHQIRQVIGLRPDQHLGLILFGKDKLLEHMWVRRHRLVREIASAAYDFCVAPSYSNYTNRPRPEFLYNAKRSLVFFQLLQRRGIPAIPRVAWLIEHDAERFARWVNANPAVACVALDFSDSSHSGWDREMRLLAIFDGLTGRRVSYFIHGPSVTDRCLDLYRRLGSGRVHLTNSRAIARPPGFGMTYADRFARELRQVEAAQRAAGTGGEDARAA